MKPVTSLRLVRRIAARPAIVFEALSTAEGIAAWWRSGHEQGWTGALAKLISHLESLNLKGVDLTREADTGREVDP